LENQTKNLKPPAQIHAIARRMFGGTGLDGGRAEEVRGCWLYTLHLALGMPVECLFRDYGADEAFNNSREPIGSAMRWLRAS